MQTLFSGEKHDENMKFVETCCVLFFHFLFTTLSLSLLCYSLNMHVYIYLGCSRAHQYNFSMSFSFIRRLFAVLYILNHFALYMFYIYAFGINSTFLLLLFSCVCYVFFFCFFFFSSSCLFDFASLLRFWCYFLVFLFQQTLRLCYTIHVYFELRIWLWMDAFARYSTIHTNPSEVWIFHTLYMYKTIVYTL